MMTNLQGNVAIPKLATGTTNIGFVAEGASSDRRSASVCSGRIKRQGDCWLRSNHKELVSADQTLQSRQ